MQTNFEQFALTSMLGHEDSPPRLAGKLCFAEEWQRTADLAYTEIRGKVVPDEYFDEVARLVKEYR